MIKLLKALVILVLLSALVGGAAGAYYLLIERPKQRDAREIAAAGPAGVPTPDPSTPDFEKIQALRRDQNYSEALLALEIFLTRYPDSTHLDEAEAMIGDIHYSELTSGRPGPGKKEYIVQRGDVLDHVAHKTHSNRELIYEANNLDRIMLRIGQKLQIPDVDFVAEVHLKRMKVVLLDHAKFFKSFKIIEARALPKKFVAIHTKVQEKIAVYDGKRVAFGTREYAGSLRSVSLAGQPNYTIYAEPDAAPGGSTPPVTGIELSPFDAAQFHTLVSVGTPVTISPD